MLLQAVAGLIFGCLFAIIANWKLALIVIPLFPIAGAIIAILWTYIKKVTEEGKESYEDSINFI